METARLRFRRAVNGLPKGSIQSAQVLSGRLDRRGRGRRRGRRRRGGTIRPLLLAADHVIVVLGPGRKRRRLLLFAAALGAGAEGFLYAVDGAEDGVARPHEGP